MNALAARALFESLVARPSAPVDLLRAALAVAAEDDPALDVEAFVGRVDALADRARLPAHASDQARLVRLNELFFSDLAFDGARCDFDDPASSFLHTVLERRTGLPIAIASLWVCVGRRAGISCDGVGFPGHFLAVARVGGESVYVDPFHGQVLDDETLQLRLREAARGGREDRSLLAPSPDRQVLARMLRNLKNLHVRHKDLPRAYAAVDRLLLATPDAVDDLRDRGLLAMQLGGQQAARRDLEAYLAVRPGAPDAGFVEAKLSQIAKSPSFLN